MHRTLAQLDADLDRFQADLEGRFRAKGDVVGLEEDLDFVIGAMLAVAGEHKAHVHERISGILQSFGLLPPNAP